MDPNKIDWDAMQVVGTPIPTAPRQRYVPGGPMRMRPRSLAADVRGDSQKKRVYDWESPWFLASKREMKLTLPQCRSLVQRLHREHCQGWTTACPVVKGYQRQSATHKFWPYMTARTAEIVLPPPFRHVVTVLHEFAHHLVMPLQRQAIKDRLDKKPNDFEGHGPEFVRAYIELLVVEMGFDRVHLAMTAKAAGVQVAPRTEKGN